MSEGGNRGSEEGKSECFGREGGGREGKESGWRQWLNDVGFVWGTIEV